MIISEAQHVFHVFGAETLGNALPNTDNTPVGAASAPESSLESRADSGRPDLLLDAELDAVTDADVEEDDLVRSLPPVPEPLTAVIPQSMAGERLDKAIAQLFPDFSRSRLQSWIESGRVRVDGETAKIRTKVSRDAVVVVTPDLLPEQLAFTPEALDLDILYEDDTLLIVNKPVGMVVHPAAGNWSGTLLNGLLHRYHDAAGLPRAGIVHRLDKDTSGLMVVARTLTAQTDLVRQLQARTVKRRYIALVWGTPAESGRIDAPIGRDPRDRMRMAVVHRATGKPARTHFTRLATGFFGELPVSVVQCDLETGRTHQIRVHFAHLGNPLIGDQLYGKPRVQRSGITLPGGFARQALHAWHLGLIHPVTGEAMAWHAELPEDLAMLAAELGVGDVLASLDESGEFIAGDHYSEDDDDEDEYD